MGFERSIDLLMYISIDGIYIFVYIYEIPAFIFYRIYACPLITYVVYFIMNFSGFSAIY